MLQLNVMPNDYTLNCSYNQTYSIRITFQVPNIAAAMASCGAKGETSGIPFSSNSRCLLNMNKVYGTLVNNPFVWVTIASVRFSSRISISVYVCVCARINV